MTSQISPAGVQPASRARSIDASVWPVRSSTPPGRALSGLTCPPLTMSCGPLAGSTAVRIVCARSAALIPVVTPSRASMVTVNGVWWAVSFFSDMSSRPSSSQRSGESARQIHPRAWVAMKLMSSAETNSAAMTRSPSFSRSSSSTTTTIRPAAISSSASSTVANWVVAGVLMSGAGSEQLLDVLREQVDLEVDDGAGGGGAQARALQGLGDEGDGEAHVVDRDDGQRDAVDGDRPLLHDVAQDLRLRLDRDHAREAVLAGPRHDADAVDVALDDVAAQARVGAQRELEVHAAARGNLGQRGPPQRLVHDLGAEAVAAHADRRQADAVDGDGVAVAQLGGERRGDGQADAVV